VLLRLWEVLRARADDAVANAKAKWARFGQLHHRPAGDVAPLESSEGAQENRLAGEPERFRLALEAASLGMWDWKPPGDAHWDRRTRELFGCEDAWVSYDRFLGAVHAADRARVDASLQALIAPGAPGDDYHLEYRVIRSGDRAELWIEARGRVLARDAQGHATRFIGTVLDTTDRKRAEDELRETAAFRERFVGIVSHDLRNPLAAIRMAATVLQKSASKSEPEPRPEPAPESIGRHAERILANVDRMTRMIGDLLDLTSARLGGGMPIEPKPVDLRDIVPGALDNVELAHPGRRLVRETRGRLDGEWDADRVAQALGNLVTNAFQHGDPGAPVHVALLDQGAGVAVRVHNEGEPIAPEQRQHLFDPFRPGPRRSGGLGLGLFIASEIARAHGGTIAVTSTATEGTTFQLQLPRHAAGRRTALEAR
jgi:signal transduction histidine kinase